MITIYNTIVINYNHIYNFLPPHFTTILTCPYVGGDKLSLSLKVIKHY